MVTGLRAWRRRAGLAADRGRIRAPGRVRAPALRRAVLARLLRRRPRGGHRFAEPTALVLRTHAGLFTPAAVFVHRIRARPGTLRLDRGRALGGGGRPVRNRGALWLPCQMSQLLGAAVGCAERIDGAARPVARAHLAAAA